jgi:hypothetical protein
MSITELKPGSNYLIVYNRGDMSKEGVAALSEELLSMVGALGASCTLVVVPDGCPMKVSEVPSSAEVLALLRSVEWWGGLARGPAACPACEAESRYGHASDCAIDAMVKRCETAPSFAVETPPLKPMVF